MRKKTFSIVSLLVLCFISMNLFGQTYNKLWQQVNDAESKGLPQSAMKIMDDIFQKAIKEKNSGQMLYAYTRKAEKQQQITPDSFYVTVQYLEEWLETPAVSKLDAAVIHTILANVYSEYASNNRWQLRPRTNIVDEEPSEDMREWSSNMFVDKVISHTQMAMTDSVLLLKSSTKDYIPFVTQYAGSEYYRHDMYHLLAMQSITALTNISVFDADSNLINLINNIFTRMIDTYRRQNNSEGALLSSLDKLNWEENNMKQSNYLIAIDELLSTYSSSAVIAEVYLSKARYLQKNNDYVKALSVLDDAIAKYPKYNRIDALKALRENILRPDLTVSTNSTVYPGEDLTMNINHRNLSGFTVKLYSVNLPVTSELLAKSFNEDFKKQYTKEISSQHYSLDAPSDYRIKEEVMNMKAPGVGLYLMEIVPDEPVQKLQSYLLTVTRLSVLSRKLPGDKFEMIVLDGLSGKPVPDARIRLFEGRKGDRVEVNSIMTNADGKINIPWSKEYQYMTADKGDDSGMLIQTIYGGYYSFQNNSTNTSMTLLTDRAVYRPGQTVYVKGIAFTQNQEKDSAGVIANKNYTLSFLDANSKEINKKEVTTNEFGSFTAEFVVPTGGLNGMYSLRTSDAVQMIRVEEYKRPTFDITFEKLQGSYGLGDKVQIKGNVKTFSGVVVQEVPVKYTVKRSARGWWRPVWENGAIIASGEVALDEMGQFDIPVTLEPNNSLKDLGYFIYTVEATVTNVAGETQSSTTSIAAGSRSIVLTADFKDRINKDDSIKVTFNATNLNGQPVDISGEYKLYPFTDYKEKKASSESVYSGTFKSNVEMNLEGLKKLPSGAYKIVVTAKDNQNRELNYETETVLFSINDTRPPVESEIWYYEINTEYDGKKSASFTFGTSLTDVYVMMDVFSGNKHLESRVLHLTDSIIRFDYPYKEEYENGIIVYFSFLRNNILYQQEARLTKKLPDNELKMKWEVFRDNLRPGQKEEWKLTIKKPEGTPADAEMLAAMYDVSLDKIWPLNQSLKLYYWRNLPSTNWMQYPGGSNYYPFGFIGKSYTYKELMFDRFWNSYIGNLYDNMTVQEMAVVGYGTATRQSLTGAVNEVKVSYRKQSVADTAFEEEAISVVESGGSVEVLPEGGDNLRTNFAETAFFYPQLRTNEKGDIVISFTMPESLTRWKFHGYAHTKDMLTGYMQGETVTSKEFMLTPNLPRFVRVGDKTSVAASVANLTGKSISGTVIFTLFDPMTDKVISTQRQKFNVEAGKTTGVNFMFTATAEYDVLGCRLVAEGGRFSDGEQHLLPVLSNKENIIETVAMPIRGNETREFSLESLFNNNSNTATNRRLTIEFSGNPAWYAVQALPSLSLPTYDNAASWAAAYYVNSLASYIMNDHPQIKTIFDTWKMKGGTKETFISNLQKNQDVKNIILEESPWLIEAKSEAEQMERIATLFDVNNITNNNISALNKLRDLQLNNGAWAWYKGMTGNIIITSYVVEVLARLTELTNEPLSGDVIAMQNNAFRYLHQEAQIEYNRLRELEKKGTEVKGITYLALNYLYLIAISDVEVPSANRTIQEYFLDRLSESITTLSLKNKANAAVTLYKAGRTKDAEAFLASLKEYSVTTDELGMHYAFNESPYTWAGLKIPAHVAVMEAFDVVAKDEKAVEEMKLWLLKQKQTQQWDSPVSTVNAIYALLNRGNDLLESRGDVRITLGGKVIETLNPAGKSIPGISYVKEVITDKNTIDKAKKVTVEKRDAGIAWGAVYAQYQEDIDKVRQTGGELNVDKKLYVERVVGTKKELLPVAADTELKIGDKVVSRITIRLDRAMDFIQLKDQRGSCFEPIENISGYRWGNGNGYYIAVKDASTNFFFDSLAKGVYVLEYSYRVSRAGEYAGGLAILQSAYAPEYASHSASVKVKVAEK